MCGARDFAILELDLWKRGAGNAEDLGAWHEAYGGSMAECPVLALLATWKALADLLVVVGIRARLNR